MLSIKEFLLRALLRTLVEGCRNFGISAKLAAIEAINRVFPSSPGIDYQMA
jgi:hypothetical protein